MRRALARLGALLVCVTGLGAFGGAPAVAAPGFDLDVTELPGTFRAGAGPQRVSAVVSTTNDGCRKVLWSLVLRVEGLRLDQVRIDRIEQNGSFPVRVNTDGNTARITDNQLDPGTLCRGRTVTAQYLVAIAGDATDGRIVFTPEAYDANQRLLARASASRQIINDRSRRDRADRAEREPTRSPKTTTPPPVAQAEEPADADEAVPDGAGSDQSAQSGGAESVGGQPGAGAGRADATATTRDSGSGLVTVGFVAGGLMLFLGVGLLLRLRQRMTDEDELATEPGFHHGSARTVPRGGFRAGTPTRRRRRPSTVRY